MPVNHLQKRGLRVVPDFLVDSNGERRKDLEVVGRRSRKEWSCAAADRCEMRIPIEEDEVYVEVLRGTNRYTGNTDRYHRPCAISLKIVERQDDAADRTNSRRLAIMTQRASMKAKA